MKYAQVFLLFIFLGSVPAWAETILYKVGDAEIILNTSGVVNGNVYVALHENEKTSIETGKQAVSEKRWCHN